jgi:dTDP-4-amino-4,6-dideoxygalactose transaminase
MLRSQPHQGAVPSNCAPTTPPPLPGWPHYDDEQIAAVVEVLRSGEVNYWNGEQGRAFEQEFADYVGTPHAVAVANGTLALELALIALDIPAGTEVIVPCRTFLATASAVVARGCRPVFADVDPHSGNICAETIAPLITPRTSGIICVHLAGWPCEMDEIRALADRHGLKVIEDCAQAHGAEYKGFSVGSLGDAAAFSFCTDKIISTGGEGGMLTLSDEAAWKRAWSYKDHGKGWDTVYNTQHPGVFRWLHDSLGSNWRMPEVASAIGRIQLRRLPWWVATRRQHAATLRATLSQHPAVTIPQPPEHAVHSYYKFYAYLNPAALDEGVCRDEIVRRLQEAGVPAGSGSCSEIYLERAFQEAGLAPAEPCLAARQLGETSLMFVVHPTLSSEDVAWMGRTVRRVLDEAVGQPQRLRAAA